MARALARRGARKREGTFMLAAGKRFRPPSLCGGSRALMALGAPLADEGLREALALAIDKRGLAAETRGGVVAPTNQTNHLMPLGAQGCNPALVGPDMTRNLSGNAAKDVKQAQAFASSRCEGQFTRCPALTLAVSTAIAWG